jgi:hypothetical protein
MLFDTTGVSMIWIPEEKLLCSLATIEYVLTLNEQGIMSRLTAAVAGGFLQSLMEGTPLRQGQTYLWKL